MANEQLKQALRNAGLDVNDLAVRAEVDTKTAQRWVSGRTPRPRYRRRVAEAVGVPETVLWPSALPGQADEPPGDTIEAITAAGDQLDWQELAAEATDRICLLDLTLADILTHPDDVALLTDAADRGCRVRVLVSDPESIHLAITEADLGQPVTLTNRPALSEQIDRVAALLAPHTEVDARWFVGAGAYRMLLFDDQALITLRLPGLPSDEMPALLITRQAQDGILDRFARSFDKVWDTANPIPRPTAS